MLNKLLTAFLLLDIIGVACVGLALTDLRGGFEISFGKQDSRLVVMASQMSRGMK